MFVLIKIDHKKPQKPFQCQMYFKQFYRHLLFWFKYLVAVNCDPNLRVCNNEIDEVNYGGQDKCQHGVLKVAFSDPRGGGRGVMRGRDLSARSKETNCKPPKPDQVVILSPTGQPCTCGTVCHNPGYVLHSWGYRQLINFQHTIFLQFLLFSV